MKSVRTWLVLGVGLLAWAGQAWAEVDMVLERFLDLGGTTIITRFTGVTEGQVSSSQIRVCLPTPTPGSGDGIIKPSTKLTPLTFKTIIVACEDGQAIVTVKGDIVINGIAQTISKDILIALGPTGVDPQCQGFVSGKNTNNNSNYTQQCR